MVRSISNASDHQMQVKSSISLLQERFKQLQKIKKMRQEKELLKNMLMHFDHHDHMESSYNNNKFYFHSELNTISSQNNHKSLSSHFTLSLWPDIKSQNVLRSSKLKRDNSHSDVDTSLHL